MSLSYCPAGNYGMIEIVEHRNSQLSEVVFSDILDSDQIPLIGSYYS
jgi:hypothetical protein